jgi:hypothetical protein
MFAPVPADKLGVQETGFVKAFLRRKRFCRRDRAAIRQEARQTPFLGAPMLSMANRILGLSHRRGRAVPSMN